MQGAAIQHSEQIAAGANGAPVWAGEDSNLRSLRRQIYSLVRLAASLPTQYVLPTRAAGIVIFD